MNPQISKLYTALASPYCGLAEVFKKSLQLAENDEKLKAEAQEGSKLWTEDNNAGLVQQVIGAFTFFSILQLGNVYAALRVSDIAQRLNQEPADLVELGSYLSRLIEEGKLEASLTKETEDPSSWVLNFGSMETESSVLLEQRAHDELATQIVKVQNLMLHAREADRKFGLSKEYVIEAKHKAKVKEVGEAGGDQWAMPPESAFDHDEDVMGE